MEPLKHECGVAVIRLLKPLSYYKEKYGTYQWALNKLYLLMEKQHNRGQEAAGIGVVKMHTHAGQEYVFRERALGPNAIQDIFDKIRPQVDNALATSTTEKEVEETVPFLGEIYMGHLRYSTTGKAGMSYVHPFLRRNNWPGRNLMLCGNFNMTNTDAIFDALIAKGQHPRLYSDTIALLEQLGYALDHENHRIYRQLRDELVEPQLSLEIEDRVDLCRVLKLTAPGWDGGFVICGATGSGSMFVVRDRHGIRPAFYYADDEVIVVASERPVIQTVMNIPRRAVQELTPGTAMIVNKKGQMDLVDILGQKENKRCSFERIYFSRGSDADIYNERKALGRLLAKQLAESLDYKFDDAVFSFIPNTAEVAFIGMIEGLENEFDNIKTKEILRLQQHNDLNAESLADVMQRKLRIEKVAIKDIKLRTFIAEGASRNDLAAHVYDVTYGIVRNDRDTLVVIDDSIVRGTTLRQSILKMLDRLHPKRIIVVSSSPQVRYPDCYGIDMSRLGEFIAFRAAIELLKETGRTEILDRVYNDCKAMEKAPDAELRNCVKAIYEPFTDEEISAKIAEMLTPSDIKAKVDIIYQTLDNMHVAVPGCPGDWYFSGDYPTPGGIRLVNRAYINFYEGCPDKR